MAYLLALDQGTTSSRAIVFDGAGVAVAQAQREFRQHFPRPGWVEHDAMEIWQTQSQTAVQAVKSAGIGAKQIAAIGITNQRETTVVWDRQTGLPICNAIVWQDRRTAERCDRLRAEGWEGRISQRTGLLVDAYFSATKLAWVLDHVPGARDQARAGRLAFGTVDSWLIYKLTGGRVHATDVSNASRTMLFDIHRGDWDEELLALFEIDLSLLPRVVASSGVVGEASEPAELAGVPIAGIAGDQQAALMGQLCTEPGMAKNTYGTGCFALLNTGHQPVASRHKLVTTVAWQGAGLEGSDPAPPSGLKPSPVYALEGSVFVAGSVVQWLRDGLGIIKTSAQVNELAATVPDNGGVSLVPAFVGLGAPYWDSHARGTITGLTRGTTAGHIARAALEGIAHQVADVLEAMAKDAGRPLAELRVDGGAAASDLLMQLQADFLQLPLVRPKAVEATAQGAAYLAGLAVGLWKDIESLSHTWVIDKRFEPRMKPNAVAGFREQWQHAVRQCRSG